MQTRFRLVAGAFVSMLVGMSIGYLFWGRRGYSPARETVAKTKKRHHTPDMVSAGPESASEGTTCSSTSQSRVSQAFFVCDEGPRISRQACKIGDFRACERIIRNTPVNSAEREQALISIRSLCEANHVGACTFLLHNTDRESAEKKKILSKLSMRCDANHVPACKTFLDNSLEDSALVSQTKKLMSQLCESKNVAACDWIIHSFSPSDVENDLAFSVLDKLCEMKNVEACFSSLNDVSFVHVDEKKTVDVLRGQCQKKDLRACEILASKGYSLSEEFLSILKEQCEAKNFLACKLSLPEVTIIQMVEQVEKIASLCLGKDEKACEWLVSNHLLAEQKNLKDALSYFNEKCEMGDAHGCDVLSRHFTKMCGWTDPVRHD